MIAVVTSTPGGVIGTIALILSLLGVGEIVRVYVGRAAGRYRERRVDRREENADDRAELESWRSNSNQWQGQVMTLQGELVKRDTRIAQLERDVSDLREEMRTLHGEMTDILRENRRYRILLEARADNGIDTGKAD
jgi:chromosome segregation ATPase